MRHIKRWLMMAPCLIIFLSGPWILDVAIRIPGPLGIEVALVWWLLGMVFGVIGGVKIASLYFNDTQ